MQSYTWFVISGIGSAQNQIECLKLFLMRLRFAGYAPVVALLDNPKYATNHGLASRYGIFLIFIGKRCKMIRKRLKSLPMRFCSISG